MQQIQALDFSGAFCFPPTTDATVSPRVGACARGDAERVRRPSVVAPWAFSLLPFFGRLGGVCAVGGVVGGARC